MATYPTLPNFLKVKNRKALPKALAARLAETSRAATAAEFQKERTFAELDRAAREDRLKKMQERVQRARERKRVPDRVAKMLRSRSDDAMTAVKFERLSREMPTESARATLARDWVLGNDGRYHRSVVNGVVRKPVRSGAPKSAPTTTEDVMAKKARAKKANGGETTPRVIKRPAGLVEDFAPVRAGTGRATVVEMGAKGATVDAIAKELKKTRQTVMTHLYLLNRDNGIGYQVEDEKVKVTFPGSKTVRDAIKESAAAE